MGTSGGWRIIIGESIESVVQKPGHSEVYIVGMKSGGEQEQVFAFSTRSHEFTPILQVDQYIWSLSVSDARTRIAYTGEDSSRLPVVWTGERGSKPEEFIHSDFGAGQQKLGETRGVSWKINGKTHYGTVRLPMNYHAGQRYPTIVEVYPEPDSGSSVRNLFLLGNRIFFNSQGCNPLFSC